jgi:2'-5' RNA ligase
MSQDHDGREGREDAGREDGDGRDARDGAGGREVDLPPFTPPPPPESEDDDEHTAERPEAAYVEHVRAFVALDLPIATARELGKAQAELRAAWERAGEARVSWVPIENVHLTLKFLGSIPAPSTEAVAAALTGLAAGRKPPRARLRGLGAFPNPSRPSIIWAGLEDQGGGLASLASAVEARCEELGFPRERREWHPHVTLGRVRERGAPGGHPEVVISPFATRDLGDVSFREIILYRSDLTSKGARYTSLARASLAPPRDR